MADDLEARLAKAAETTSRIQQQMMEAKSLRQDGNKECRTDLYFWPTPEATLEGRALERIAILRAENERLTDLVQAMLDNLKQCSLESGCCHCGESMSNHSDPMSSGHTPVDMGWTAAEHWIEQARTALKESSHD